MATVSIRVPEELKRQMAEAGVNWSDLLRDAIEERLLLERRRRAAERMDRRADEAFRKTGKHATASAEVLRWRKLR